MSSPQVRALYAPLAVCAAMSLTLLRPRLASAYDFEVTSRTEAYGYQLRRYDLDGMQFLNVRRLNQWLGLRIFNLLDPGQEPWSPGGKRPPALLTIHAMMRLDADFGSFADASAGVPEVGTSRLQLLPVGLEGRGLFGWLDFELGRQIDMEMMSFFSFDGLRLRANLPHGLYVETEGGLQVAGTDLLGSTLFQPEGLPGDQNRARWLPTYTVAGGVDGGPAGLQLRVAYRGVVSRASPVGAVVGGPLGAPVWGTDQELLFIGARAELPWLRLRPQLGLRYNILTAQLDDLELAASTWLWGRLDGQIEYLRTRPHFDGDSIMNLFSLEPTSDLRGRLSLRLSPALLVGARLGYRWFWSPAEEGATREPGVLTAGATGNWVGSRLRSGLEGYYQGGSQGGTAGADLSGGYRLRRWLELEGRMSLLRYHDAQQQSGALVAFGVQGGVRLNLVRGVLVQLLLEDNVSRLYNSALRFMAVVALESTP